jgi:hypothetical protein
MAPKNWLTVRALDYIEQHPGVTVPEMLVAMPEIKRKSLNTVLIRARRAGYLLSRPVPFRSEFGAVSLQWFATGTGITSLSDLCLLDESDDDWTPRPWVHPYARHATRRAA